MSALFAFALFVAVSIFFFAPTDRTWVETKRALEARGEVLDWEQMIPPVVAANQNLFDDPVAASLLPLKGLPTPANPLGVNAPRLPPASESLGIPFALSNLVTLPRVVTAEEELCLTELNEWFSQWDESFACLRAAGRRPKARLPGNYFSPVDAPIPNFVSARTLAHVLGSRAKVHLLLGRSSAAFEDLETLEVVMKSLSEPGTLVTAMIHVAVAGLYLETVEEGLRHNLWAEPELQKLTAHLLQMNLFAQVKQGIRAERAGVLRMLSALAERKRDPLHQATMDAFTSGEWTVERAIIKVSPAAWVRANQADYARMIQGYLDAIDPEQRRLHQKKIDQQNIEVAELMSRWSPKNRILMYVTPSFSKAATTMAKNQMRAHQLAIACALVRYRSQHDRYPAKLEKLVPEYLPFVPNDVYTEEPIRYEVRAGGYELLVSDPQARQPANPGNFIWQGE